MSAVRAEAIPAELRALPQWVIWRTEHREGRPTKVPYRAGTPDVRASSTDPATWGTFTDAFAASVFGADGVGFVFTEGDPYFGLDLDHELPEADRMAIVLALGTYTEWSPSGTGMHVIGRGSLNGSGRHPAGIGVFDRGRYFTFTGAHVVGTPLTVEECQERLAGVLAQFVPPRAPAPAALPPQPVGVDDQELLERAFAARNGSELRALWEGTWESRYPSHSEADLALATHLAFWAGRDPARMDRLFRASGLMREKWERADYRERTLAAAIAGTSEVYEPAIQQVRPSGAAPGPHLTEATDPAPTARESAPRVVSVPPTSWLERASDLLREPDPGPTTFLVEELIVEAAILALVGTWKAAKSWTLLELAVAIVTGRKAFDRYAVQQGPVILVMEESGRTAFHRRLDMLRRGYALDPGALHDLHFAANLGVRLSEPDWQQRLLDAGRELQPGLIAFDPFVRMKGAGRDENVQLDIGPVLDFLRSLREDSGAAVGYSHHTGHQGTHQRGSSDLEAYWESRLALTKDEDTGVRTLTAGHREAESGHSFDFALDFDLETRTLRMSYRMSELERAVREHLASHPTASGNEVVKALGGRRGEVHAMVRRIRAEMPS